MAAEEHPKPDDVWVGQRWAYDSTTGTVRELEVVQVWPAPAERRARLRDLYSGDSRTVDFARLFFNPRYRYLGDYSMPTGYSIHEIVFGAGGHCFRTPFGNIHGPPKGTKWTWQQAQAAAFAHEGNR